MNNKYKLILKHLLIVAVLGAYGLILSLTGIGCPIRALTGVPCPACGMTRAMLALLHFDVASYWYYNPAALLIVFAILLGVHFRPLSKRFEKSRMRTVLILCAAAIFAVYAVRLIFCLIP